MDDLEPSSTRKVALRKESVDRNSVDSGEMVKQFDVALRKESVDRNQNKKNIKERIISRSPQGERG